MTSTAGADPLEIALRYPEPPDTGAHDATRSGGVVGVPGGGPEVTVAAERLSVGTEWSVSGKLRLRRRIVTENRTIEVSVRREILELAGDDLDFRDGRLIGTAAGGRPEDQPAERAPFVAVLREEVPVVTLEVRPYERVTVSVMRVQDFETVHDTVQHEQVEITQNPHDTKEF